MLFKSKTKFSLWQHLTLGTSVGLIFFSLLSYFLTLIHLHFMLIPIIFVVDFFSFRVFLEIFRQRSPIAKNKLFLLLFVFIFGIIGQLLIIAPSGIYLNGDLVFWSSHGHDGLWHISLMNEYQKGFPLQNPVFAGERLVNYHFFSDIAPSDFNFFFKLPTLDLYFRFFPLLFSISIGALSFYLGKKMGGNFQTGIWAAIFTYFAGSFGYIVTLLKNHSIGGESIFWASQIQSSTGNPPQAAAFIIVLAFLYLLGIYIENTSEKILSTRNRVLLFICTILAGSLAVFKVYGAVVVLASLGIVGLWQLIKERKLHILFLFFTSSLLSAALYLPNSLNTGSFLIFEPWWYIRTMVVTPDRLNWIDLELKRQTYIQDRNFKRVIQVELTAFLIFFFGNLGMRFLALFSLPKFIKNSFTDYLNLTLILILFISFILPLIFLQKGVASNSIQFLQYFLLLSGIISAVTVNWIFKRVKFKFLNIVLTFTIIVLAIPTQIGLIYSFYNRLPFARVDKEELSALAFLRNNTNPDSIILAPPYNKDLDLRSSIPQIWDWSDTGYIPAISNRRTFLADTEQVDIMGYNLKPRLNLQKEIFSQVDPQLFINGIKNLNIDYLYFPKALSPKVDLTKTPFKPIFSNGEVSIWKVR